jgi:NTE family protein
MQEAHYDPDAVAGISIGAFTAAIIAGNEPTERISKLKEFWDLISWPDITPLTDPLGAIKKWHNLVSSCQGFMFGQPGFFTPWLLPPSLQPSGTPAGTSYYDTSLLLRTLPKVVDFDRINRGGKTRLILGATRVRDGSPRWFDSQREKIGPEHVMASGAMPPGFPGIRIDGELYWDGGCYSNTPLDGLYEVLRDKDTLCFVIDLFGPNGREPQSIADVSLTMKEIQFSNRISRNIERVRERHNFAHYLLHINQKHKEAIANHPHRAELEQMMNVARFDIMHILYQKPASEVSTCDCEFSKSSIQDRMQQGYCDMKKALAEREQLAEDQKEARELAPVGSVVNTFAKGTLVQTSFHPARALSKMVSRGKGVGVSLGAGGRNKPVKVPSDVRA